MAADCEELLEMLPTSIINRLTLSRYLFLMAEDSSRIGRTPASGAGINLLQDSIELFLLAASHHLNARIGQRTEFVTYLDKIDEVLAPDRALSRRTKLIEINNERIRSKHAGIPPSPDSLAGYVDEARQFLGETTLDLFGIDFWNVHLLDLLEEGEPRDHLRKASEEIEDGEFYQALLSIRKSIYLSIESSYDISPFEHTRAGNGIIGALCKSPYYAKTPEYLRDKVKDPFDRIVLDHDRIDADLVRAGAPVGDFWNIWRMTPEVYRRNRGDMWQEKFDPAISEHENLDLLASSMLDAANNILIRLQKYKREHIYIGSRHNFYITIDRTEGDPTGIVPVFTKASRSSQVVKEIVNLPAAINVEYSTPALDGEGTFWKVFQVFGEYGTDEYDVVFGYVDDFNRVED